jgi:hypothetical protein
MLTKGDGWKRFVEVNPPEMLLRRSCLLVAGLNVGAATGSP